MAPESVTLGCDTHRLIQTEGARLVGAHGPGRGVAATTQGRERLGRLDLDWRYGNDLETGGVRPGCRSDTGGSTRVGEGPVSVRLCGVIFSEPFAWLPHGCGG